MTFEEANETAKDKDDVMEKFGIKYAYTICDNCVYGNGSFNCIGRMVTIFRVVGECRFFKNKNPCPSTGGLSKETDKGD